MLRIWHAARPALCGTAGAMMTDAATGPASATPTTRPGSAKPGRPSLAVAESRVDRVAFRMTAEELARVQAEAERAGVSVSEYCRAAALGQRVRVRSAPDLSAALVSLNRVGVNLNQITRTLNAGQPVPVDLD
ncbi:plasmid mobilization protein, partial [Paracoccus nototheniae]